MKTTLKAATCILACAAIAGAGDIENLKISADTKTAISIKSGAAVPSINENTLRVPSNPGQLSPNTQILTYASPAAYTFENEAKKALNTCVSNFQAAGLSVINSRTVAKGNDYSFTVEYADGNNVMAQLPAFSIIRYETPASYWIEADAKKALQQSTAWFRSAGINVIGGTIFERDTQNNAFTIDYVTTETAGYYAPQYIQPKTGTYTSRQTFSFENQARSAANLSASSFATAGIRVLDAYAVPTDDNNFRFAIAYLSKTGQGTLPALALKTYQSSEEFSFENEAKKGMTAKAALFNNAGLRVVDAYPVPLGNQNNDFGFVLKYLVRNMQGYNGQTYEEAAIQLYQETQTYPFENNAKKAMQERQRALSNAGFAILGGRVIPAGNDYTFVVEYVAKTQPPQVPQYPQYPQQPQYPQGGQPQYQPQPQQPQQGGHGQHQPGHHTTIEVTEE